jgi:Single-strand binding protein family
VASRAPLIGDSSHAPQKPQNPQKQLWRGFLWFLWILRMGAEGSQGTAARPVDHASQSLTKGSRVVVMGRLQQRSWIAEDGSARQVVEVVAEELGPSLRWATATPARVTKSTDR